MDKCERRAIIAKFFQGEMTDKVEDLLGRPRELLYGAPIQSLIDRVRQTSTSSPELALEMLMSGMKVLHQYQCRMPEAVESTRAKHDAPLFMCEFDQTFKAA